ncbi:hypothetical protein UPYG_G00167390 [Umbra pygmaea]|uniref:Uncharacterized protein n=1 Tax=Umbra pygmaea TaxID=75934 RepID=A0ABD0WMX5_UMBPY
MSQYFNSDTAGLQSEDEGSQRKRKKKKRHVSDSEPEESQSPDPSARLYDLDEGRSYTNLNFPTSSRPQFSAMNPNPSDISPLTLPDGRDVQQFNSPSCAPGYQNKQGFTGTSTFPLSCRTDSLQVSGPMCTPETLVHDPSVLTAARPLDQINRTFINRSGPTSASSDQNCVFQPVFRVGQGGPIPCSAAQQHILLMLENIKQQQSQLAATVNILLTRMGSTPPRLS